MAKAKSAEKRVEFTNIDMVEFGLVGQTESAARRRKLGAELGIGYANAKQFVNRLNIYSISREEFEAACNICFALNHLD